MEAGGRTRQWTPPGVEVSARPALKRCQSLTKVSSQDKDCAGEKGCDVWRVRSSKTQFFTIHSTSGLFYGVPEGQKCGREACAVWAEVKIYQVSVFFWKLGLLSDVTHQLVFNEPASLCLCCRKLRTLGLDS